MQAGEEIPESKVPKYSIGLEKEAHLTDYINVVLRRWKLVLIIFAVVFVGIAVKTFLTQPVYEAFATLEVRKPQQGGMLKELGVESDDKMSTEIEILKSRSLAEKVAQRLNLDWQVTESSEQLNVEFGEFAIDSALPGLVISLTDPLNYRVADLSGRQLGTGRSGVPLRLPAVTAGEQGDGAHRQQ